MTTFRSILSVLRHHHVTEGSTDRESMTSQPHATYLLRTVSIRITLFAQEIVYFAGSKLNEATLYKPRFFNIFKTCQFKNINKTWCVLLFQN
uniref:Uncharacterized protein n=1 Tax=Ciona intestinalis TaxID=7719 RepID=H2XSH9_CIOIN